MLFTQVATGTCHIIALRRDGSVIAWGNNLHGRCSGAPPSSDTSFIAVAAGYDHAMALRNDGHLAVWGNNDKKQATRPELIDPSKFPGNVFVRFSAIDAGEKISAGIIDMPEYPSIHGYAMVWGAVPSTTGGYQPPDTYPPYDQFGYISPPGVVLSNPDVASGRIRAISGVGHHLLIQLDSTDPSERVIHGWGMNFGDYDFDRVEDTQSSVPQPNPAPAWVRIAPLFATGHRHSLALSTTGELWGWGMNGCGQTGYRGGAQFPPSFGRCSGLPAIDAIAPPETSASVLRTPTKFYRVTGGYHHSIGIKQAPGTSSDATLIGWGLNTDRQCSPLPLGKFIAVSSTHFFGIGIRCYADANQNGALEGGTGGADVVRFDQDFAAGQLWTDCDGNGILTGADRDCFLAYLAAGCF